VITYEQKQRIEELKKKFDDIIEVFHPEDKKTKLKELEEESLKPDFWNDQKRAQQVNREIQRTRKIIEDMERIKVLFEDIEVGIELSEEDPSMQEHLEEMIEEVAKK